MTPTPTPASAASAVAAGSTRRDAALAAAVAAIEQHFWSDAEPARWEFLEMPPAPTRALQRRQTTWHSVEAYLAAGDVTGTPLPARAASISTL